VTLTLEYDKDCVKLNQHAKYVVQRSFSSKVIVGMMMMMMMMMSGFV